MDRGVVPLPGLPLLVVSPEQGPQYPADLVCGDAIAAVGKVDPAGRAVDVDVQIPTARFGSRWHKDGDGAVFADSNRVSQTTMWPKRPHCGLLLSVGLSRFFPYLFSALHSRLQGQGREALEDPPLTSSLPARGHHDVET